MTTSPAVTDLIEQLHHRANQAHLVFYTAISANVLLDTYAAQTLPSQAQEIERLKDELVEAWRNDPHGDQL